MTGSGLPGAPCEWYNWTADRNIESMVGVAQLVEHRIVIPAVVGSNPIVHPIFFRRQIIESALAKRAISSTGRASDS